MAQNLQGKAADQIDKRWGRQGFDAQRRRAVAEPVIKTGEKSLPTASSFSGI